MGLNRPHLRYRKQTPRERTWTIHFIAFEKAVKGIVLLIVAFKMLTLFGRDVHAWAEDLVTRHGIDLANRYVHSMLERLVGVGDTQLVEFSVGATVYAGLLFTEGIGLWLQKRWAEYMTAGLTALFIPFELFELYERFTWVRIGILALNIFVVWYLATRLKDEKEEVSTVKTTESSKTKIKICGITNLEDALLAVNLGADDLGFNFYEKSPRYIAPEKAKEIIAELPANVMKIGVFVNESVERICEISAIAGLDAVQLHGDEDDRFIDAVHIMCGLPVIKAIKVTPDFSAKDAAHSNAEAVLLDKFSPKEHGGTGETFDWNIAKQVSASVERVYLAGGLTPENVGEAIRTVRPYAVDVCSRIESEPGKKDAAKLKQFIDAVRKTI
jgi:phosphoribosylanthranilate isomerase